MNIDFNFSVESSEPSNSSDSEFKDILNEFKDKKKSITAIKKIKSADRSRRRLKKTKIICYDDFFIVSYAELLAQYSKNKSNKIVSKASKVNELTVNSSFFMVNFFDRPPVSDNTYHIDLYKLKYINRAFLLKRSFFNRKNLSIEHLNLGEVIVNYEHINVRRVRHYQVYFKGHHYSFALDSNGISSIKEGKNECS